MNKAGWYVCVCVTHSDESVQECVTGWSIIAQGNPPSYFTKTLLSSNASPSFYLAAVEPQMPYDFSDCWMCCFSEFTSDFLSIKVSIRSSTESLASGLAFSDARTHAVNTKNCQTSYLSWRRKHVCCYTRVTGDNLLYALYIIVSSQCRFSRGSPIHARRGFSYRLRSLFIKRCPLNLSLHLPSALLLEDKVKERLYFESRDNVSEEYRCHEKG